MRLNLRRSAPIFALLGVLEPLSAAQPVGTEFQANNYTTGNQRRPAVAQNESDEFFVAWQSFGSSGTDTEFWSIQGRLFDSQGSPLGDQFQVNSYTTGSQYFPAVAAMPSGFVVVWHSDGSGGTDTHSESVQGRLFDSDGAPVGDQFQVNTYTSFEQWYPAVATDANGEFVVTWASRGGIGTDSISSSIQVQRFDELGEPVGDQFQVNSYTTGDQVEPVVAVAPGGGFVVAWEGSGSAGSDKSSDSIHAQPYDAGANPLGPELQVNSYTTNIQVEASVGVDANGAFTVSWTSVGSAGGDTNLHSVQAQRFTAGGSPLGGQVQVNSYTTGSQFDAAVFVDRLGQFVVTWASNGSDGTDQSGFRIDARRFDAGGNAIGEQFQANSYVTDDQVFPLIAGTTSGDFVIVWQSFGSAGTDDFGDSILGQAFAVHLLSDGFESHDVCGWSTAVGSNDDC